MIEIRFVTRSRDEGLRGIHLGWIGGFVADGVEAVAALG